MQRSVERVEASMGPVDFSTFEHEGWERVARPYHEYFGDLTTQSNGAMLQALRIHRGVRFLDVASGPGYLAAAAARRGAEVTGVDFSAAMVAQARRVFPGVDFRIGDAESLPFADESFGAVGISFGMLHFPQPERALAEAFRVLQPGGRFAFTVWAAPEKAVGFGIVLNAINEHGTMDVGLPPGPPFFKFSDSHASRQALLNAGFVRPEVQEVNLTLVLHAPDAFFDVLMRGGVRVAALLKAQQQDELALIERAIAQEAEKYRDGNGELRIPMACVLASAIKA
jgi:ubiquinone/menaquinone biosynthesis C-methylase UbiE